MRFEKGRQKTGGRQKGTPNKIVLDFQKRLDRHGIDPIERLAKILPELSPEQQANIFLRMLPYLYPTRKAVEINDDPKDPSNALTEQTSQILSVIESA